MMQPVVPMAGPPRQAPPHYGIYPPPTHPGSYVRQMQTDEDPELDGCKSRLCGSATLHDDLVKDIADTAQSKTSSQRNKSQYIRPPRLSYPNRRRTHPEEKGMHSTPKKVRFEERQPQGNQGPPHSPILIHSPNTVVITDLDSASQDDSNQSFLGNGRATECTDRSPHQRDKIVQNQEDESSEPRTTVPETQEQV